MQERETNTHTGTPTEASGGQRTGGQWLLLLNQCQRMDDLLLNQSKQSAAILFVPVLSLHHFSELTPFVYREKVQQLNERVDDVQETLAGQRPHNMKPSRAQKCNEATSSKNRSDPTAEDVQGARRRKKSTSKIAELLGEGHDSVAANRLKVILLHTVGRFP